MSRRSSRLLSGGYYNSDEESDSSSVTNITYRENPVKVFKKKAGTRKAVSRPSSRASGDARSPGLKSPVTVDQCDGLSPSHSSSQPKAVMRTDPYAFTTVTPRPALTPTRGPSVTPERSLYAGQYSSTRPGLHQRPDHKELSQSGVESSGYSSSEGTYKKPAVAPSSSAGLSEPRKTGYRKRISSAFFSLMDSASSMTEAAHSKVKHLSTLANALFTSHMKKTCGLFLLLLLLLLLCVWFLFPLTFSTSHVRGAKTPSQTKPDAPPVISDPEPAPPPQLNTVRHHAPAVDPAVVSAAVEERMQHVLAELLLKQEQLFSQMKEGMDADMQGIKSRLDAVDSDTRQRLQLEVAGLGKKMALHHTDSQSAAAGLSLRIQAVEEVNAKLSQELSSINLMPPPAPCPETPPAPAPPHDELTPELLQAMEKWLTDRIQEQDVLADSGRPMADKMADFALETQGASVISTRCSETYRFRSACVTLFGFPLWYPSESPRTVIQGYPVLLPGKCWAFHGVQGILVISLSHPVRITHVTLDHLPRCNSPTGRIDSAPKDFEVYGMRNDTEEGTLLGTFTYDEDGESTQTFELPQNPSEEVYRFVELRVLSNWGHVEYTCLYRFRVHGKMAST